MVNTFLGNIDLTGKNVIPFCTSSSDEIEGSMTDIQNSAEEANGGNWLEGHRFRSNPFDSDIQEWTDSIQ